MGAENKCRKFKNRKVQWCPQVTMAINIILFWKSILKRETGGKVGLSILRSQAKKAHIDTIPYPGDYQIKTLNKIISKAYKQFHHLKLDENRCNTWMAQLIAAQAAAWNKTKKALWQQLRRTEKIRKMANTVKQALHKSVIHKPLSLVIAPETTSGLRKEHHQKADLEQACLNEAGRWFTQANNTPFLSPPLIHIFGKATINKEAKQVLEGKFTSPPHCDPYAALFLASLRRPQSLPDISPRTTADYS